MRDGVAGRFDERPLEDRVIAFRRSVVSLARDVARCSSASTHRLAGNVPWFFIPAGLMFLNVLRKGGSIWSDGVGPIDAFKKGIRAKLRAQRGEQSVASALPRGRGQRRRRERPNSCAARLAAADVLAGRARRGRATRRGGSAYDARHRRGAAARRAGDDSRTSARRSTRSPSASARWRRRSTAWTRDVSGASLGALDARIAALGTEPATAGAASGGCRCCSGSDVAPRPARAPANRSPISWRAPG